MVCYPMHHFVHFLTPSKNARNPSIFTAYEADKLMPFSSQYPTRSATRNRKKVALRAGARLQSAVNLTVRDRDDANCYLAGRPGSPCKTITLKNKIYSTYSKCQFI